MEPEPAFAVAVVEPYDVEVPYSNHQSVAAPPGFTVPFTVADVPATVLTVPVIADGAAAAAAWTTARAASDTTRTITDERRRCITTEPSPVP